jgi:hypothetical protein
MADQVDLGGAGGQDLLHLQQQLLAAHFGAVGGRDLRHVDIGAAAAQRRGDAVEIIDRPTLSKPNRPCTSTMGYLVWV